MAVQAFTNIKPFVAGYDFTSDSNNATLNLEAAQLDSTTFGSNGWMEVSPGLKSTAFQLGGWFSSAADQAPDPQAFAALGASKVVTLSPTGVEGESAYLFQAMGTSYQIGGQVGDLAPFTLAAQGSDGVGVVRGALAKARGTVSATGATGAELELGAVASDEYLYATLHVFSEGTTITIDIESDVDGDFASPATQGTIGPITTPSGTWMTRVAGPITDTFYRFNIDAITGSFIIAGAIGIR